MHGWPEQDPCQEQLIGMLATADTSSDCAISCPAVSVMPQNVYFFRFKNVLGLFKVQNMYKKFTTCKGLGCAEQMRHT